MTSSPETITLDANELDARLIWANEKEVAPQHLHITSNGSAYTVCWFVERGTVRISGKSGELTAGKGTWLFPAAGGFTQKFSAGATILSLRFDLALRGGAPLFLKPMHRKVSAITFPELEHVARKLILNVKPWVQNENLEQQRSSIPLQDHLRIDATFREWLAEYVEVMLNIGEVPTRRPQHDPMLQKALTQVEEHPMREPFSVNGLAKSCGLSTNHLIRIFHHSMGIPPHAYYEKRRLRCAHRALETQKLPLKEIAYELGFSSPAHFSTWFKRKEGTSPREWRKRLGG